MTQVQVTFMGTGAGNCVYRAHTAIVLDWANGLRVLLDAGSGNSVVRNGAEVAMSVESFDQVLLSHHHADHMGGLPHLQGVRTRIEPNGPPLEVYSSEESSERVQQLFRVTSITHSVDRDGLETSEGQQIARWHPTESGEWLDLGAGNRACCFPVDHISGAVGWRVESDGLAVVFSGDTRFSPSLVEAAQGAHLLIHEAFGTETDKERTHQRGHSTAAEAARAARLAGVSELILTHIDTPFHFDPLPLIDEARQHFVGPISVAGDLSQFTVATG